MGKEEKARTSPTHHRPGVYSSSPFDGSGASPERPKQRLFHILAVLVCLALGGGSAVQRFADPVFPTEEVWW